MVAPLSDIQKQLSTLTAEALNLRQQLVSAYKSYLVVLSESVQTQLVQICFELCTERHAQEFLSLSLTQRQTLQQDIQKLGLEIGQTLIQHGEKSLPETPPAETNPITIYEVVGQLENQVSECLHNNSHAVNRLLEHHNILKIKSLDALFELVAKAEKSGRSITNPPLQVKAIIDAKDDNDDEHPIQPLTAIYLQKADLEFADAKLLNARHPIRTLLQQLSTLHKRYEQKLEEETIAEASAAWRASWYGYNSEN